MWRIYLVFLCYLKGFLTFLPPSPFQFLVFVLSFFVLLEANPCWGAKKGGSYQSIPVDVSSDIDADAFCFILSLTQVGTKWWTWFEETFFKFIYLNLFLSHLRESLWLGYLIIVIIFCVRQLLNNFISLDCSLCIQWLFDGFASRAWPFDHD